MSLRIRNKGIYRKTLGWWGASYLSCCLLEGGAKGGGLTLVPCLLLLLLFAAATELLEVPTHKHGGQGEGEVAAIDVGWSKGDGRFSFFGSWGRCDVGLVGEGGRE